MATKQPTAYTMTVHGNQVLCCPRCVVATLISLPGWDSYEPRFDIGFYAEAELNHIAEVYGIVRSMVAVKDLGFPLPEYRKMDGTFCDSCLWWFGANKK